MLRSYLTLALRTLWKEKGYAFINVFGLAVGIAFCALIFLYLRHEWSYDAFHDAADRLVRVHRVSFAPDGTVHDTDTSLPFPAGPAFLADLPEVEQYVRFYRMEQLVRRGDRALDQQVFYTDPQVFDVFSFPLVQGDPASALADPSGAVLTETTARAFFGDADPMGQRLTVRTGQTDHDVVVTGVMADIPSASSLQFDVLLPLERLLGTVPYFAERRTRWTSSAFKTYLLLREGASLEAVRAKMPGFRAKYYPDAEADLRARGLWTGDGIPTSYDVLPITDIHLTPEVRSYGEESSPVYSYILGGLALAVLLIACINFMTLAIGRSARRAVEVGVRKAVGADRRQLMAQFWGEALLMSTLALAGGLVLAEVFLPVFNDLAGKTLRFDLLRDAAGGVVLLGVTLVTGLIAGSYPAAVLSRLRPTATLKGGPALRGAHGFTRALVVVQFSLSVFLIAATLVMLDQIDYLRSRPLGFDEEQVVVIDASDVDGAQVLGRFRQRLTGHAAVAGLTGTNTTFGEGFSRLGFEYEGAVKQVVEFHVESDYLDVMGMDLIAGRTFDPSLPTDSGRVIVINEALARDFGWAEPLGQPLRGATGSPETDPVVIGVVRDFNFRSLHTEVEPMMLVLGPRRAVDFVVVRLRPGDVREALGVLRETWQQAAPTMPFQYRFLDEALDAQYRAEERWSRILGYGALFAVLIACLGLFGLTALTVASRTKEIGIRKVLGASIAGVTLLLSKDFARLILVAVAVATPAAYLAMRSWLGGFAYRVELGAGLFALAGLLALAVALLTVSYQAVRAALADPVESLRYE